jgi:hypothetical protein
VSVSGKGAGAPPRCFFHHPQNALGRGLTLDQRGRVAGIHTPGPRLSALAGNRLLYRDGVPAATLSGGEIRFVDALDSATKWFARKALVRGTRRTPSIGTETDDRRDAEQPDFESASS